jgi:hypothetical protein
VDYRTNYSTCFSADINLEKADFEDGYDVFFVISKTLMLASNYLLGRCARRRQLLSSSIEKGY